MGSRREQNIWNFIYAVFFAILFAVLLLVLYRVHGTLPTTIPVFDLVLVVLATFRLVRLFVYDKIMRWLKDLLGGAERGPLKTAFDLLDCPWCFGVWAGTFVVFFYFLIPSIAWPVILVLAVAGVASFIQLAANMIGWTAESQKRRVTGA